MKELKSMEHNSRHSLTYLVTPLGTLLIATESETIAIHQDGSSETFVTPPAMDMPERGAA